MIEGKVGRTFPLSGEAFGASIPSLGNVSHSYPRYCLGASRWWIFKAALSWDMKLWRTSHPFHFLTLFRKGKFSDWRRIFSLRCLLFRRFILRLSQRSFPIFISILLCQLYLDVLYEAMSPIEVPKMLISSSVISASYNNYRKSGRPIIGRLRRASGETMANVLLL